MPTHRNLLIVVADGEHVRFVRPAAGNALQTQAALESPVPNQRAAGLGRDRPGASPHTGSALHHALAPRHDPHLPAKTRFALSVAHQLDAGADTFDELVVVAPPHIQADISAALDPATEAKLIGTLSKDLAKTPDDELWPHLWAWVRPAHRLAV